MGASLANVDDDLAERVAEGLGMAVPEPLPRALKRLPKPEIQRSPALSLLARPGDGSIRTRRVAILVPGGKQAVILLGGFGHALEVLKDQYRHAKPIAALGEAADLLEGAGISPVLPSGELDPGLIVRKESSADEVLPDFVTAIGQHRHHARETAPPLVSAAAPTGRNADPVGCPRPPEDHGKSS